MNINAGADSITDAIKKGVVLRMAAYLLAVMLVFSVISILCEIDTIQGFPSGDGAVDLTGIDFDKDIVTITFDAIHIYDYAFYMPEDFASGSVTQEAVRLVGIGPTLGDYGTIRILLKLPAGNVYAVSAKNTSYAQRMFIDGKEYPPIGVTADSAGAITPRTMRYTFAFQPESDVTEIILHYTNFVHSDTGGWYPMNVGLVNNIARSEQLKTLRIIFVTASLVTAALFFFGMFLYFMRGRYFLWFSLACGCIAIRGLLTGDKALMLLLPDLNWYLAIRLEDLATCGMALFAALYLNALFPRAGNKWAVRGFAVYCALFSAFICLTPPLVFTRYGDTAKVIYAAFCAYLLLAGVVKTLLKKTAPALPSMSQVLLLLGFSVYVLLSALGINAHNNAYTLWGLDYPQVGMMVFVFLNILALVLGFAHTERAMAESRRKEQEYAEENAALDKLNRMKTEFMQDMSHEMKNPLTVIATGIDYADREIKKKDTDFSEAGEALNTVRDETQRLGRMIKGMVDLASMETSRNRKRINFAVLLHNSAEAFRLTFEQRNITLTVDIADGLPDVFIENDRFVQVMTNLFANAADHTQNGRIFLSADYDDSYITVRVRDTGAGVPPGLLSDVFKRGVSGRGGTGYGLYLCRVIVEAHGGTIEVENGPDGIGAVVTFTVPVYGGQEAGHQL